VRDKSAPDGQMDAEMQSGISNLMGCTSTKVHVIMKEAADKIKKLNNSEEIREMVLEEPSSEDSSQEIFMATELSEDSEDDSGDLF
jgi:hypothetical protein